MSIQLPFYHFKAPAWTNIIGDSTLGITVPVGCKVLRVSLAVDTANSAVTTPLKMLLGATSFTLKSQTPVDAGGTGLVKFTYELLNPTAGAGTITYKYDNTTKAIHLIGIGISADNGLTLTDVTQAYATSTTASLSVPAVSGDVSVFGLVWNNQNTATATGGQTVIEELGDGGTGTAYHCMSYKVSSGSANVASWTNPSQKWTLGGFNIHEDAGTLDDIDGGTVYPGQVGATYNTTGLTPPVTALTTNVVGVSGGSIVDTGGDGTFTVSDMIEGAVYASRPATATFTATASNGTAFKTGITVTLKPTEVKVVLASPNTTDVRYLTYWFAANGHTPVSGDELYYIPYSDLTVAADGRILVTAAGSFTAVHRVAADSKTYYYTVTVSEFGVVLSIDSDDIVRVAQNSFSFVTTGFSTLTTITTNKPGITVSNISGVSTGTADLSDRVNAAVYPSIPVTTTFTFSGGGISAMRDASVVLKTSEVKQTLVSPLATDITYVGYYLAAAGHTAVTGDELYYIPVNNLVIAPDSKISIDSPGTFTVWHRVAADGKNYTYTISTATVTNIDTDDIVRAGQTGFTFTTVGFTTVSSITTNRTGLTVSNISGVSSGTADLADRVNGAVYPSLPATTIFTFYDGAASASRTATVALKAGEVKQTLTSPLATDPTYVGYYLTAGGHTAVTGDELYYVPTGDLSIAADSKISLTGSATFTVWHRVAADGKTYSYSITVAAVTSVDTDNIVKVGQSPFTFVTAGFSALTSITTNKNGLTVSNISGVSTGTADLADRTNGAMYPSTPTTATFTFHNGAVAADRDVTVALKTNEFKQVLASPAATDYTYVGYYVALQGRTLVTGDELYYIPVNNLVIAADGKITMDSPGSFTVWLRVAATGRTYSTNISTATVTSIDSDDSVKVGQVGFTFVSAGFASAPVITTDKPGVTVSSVSGTTTGTANLSDRVNGGVYPSTPVSALFTFTDGTAIATRIATISLKTNEVKQVAAAPLATDQTFVAYHLAAQGYALVDGDEIYYVPVNNLVIGPDSKITMDSPATFSIWLRLAADGTTHQYSIVSGIVTNIDDDNSVKVGQIGFTFATTGFSAPLTITTSTPGVTVSAISGISSGTANLSDRVQDELYPSIPTTTTFTFTDGLVTGTKAATIALKTGELKTVVASPISTGTQYLGYFLTTAGYPPVNGDEIYYVVINGLVIDPDTRIHISPAASFVAWHRVAATGKVYRYTITAPTTGHVNSDVLKMEPLI